MTAAWLTQDVPLWAFVAALLTRPSRWSNMVMDAARARFGGDAA
jgi:hypothetical protein